MNKYFSKTTAVSQFGDISTIYKNFGVFYHFAVADGL